MRVLIKLTNALSVRLISGHFLERGIVAATTLVSCQVYCLESIALLCPLLEKQRLALFLVEYFYRILYRQMPTVPCHIFKTPDLFSICEVPCFSRSTKLSFFIIQSLVKTQSRPDPDSAREQRGSAHVEEPPPCLCTKPTVCLRGN